jgi:arsenate reductase (thioredoxin)
MQAWAAARHIRIITPHIGELIMHCKKLFSAIGLVIVFLLAACSAAIPRADKKHAQVLFVCEHGNVKSLMATEYFNELAQARDLPYRATSRGVALDSDTVPSPIIAAMRTDGFDVSGFRPAAVTSADLAASSHVVLIGTAIPATVSGTTPESETWTDVPPASVNYAAARDSLKAHIKSLIEQLERDQAR